MKERQHALLAFKRIFCLLLYQGIGSFRIIIIIRFLKYTAVQAIILNNFNQCACFLEA